MTDVKSSLDLSPTAERAPSETPNDAAVELPSTKPFEGWFFLRKEWIDQEEGIEKVTLNYTIGPANLPADWSHTHTYEMMPEWGTNPLHRTWIIRLPTHLEEKDRYLFHYYFQVHFHNGSERVSHTFTQLIMPHAFEFLDHAGDFLYVRLHWSVGPWSYPQDTEMEVEGIDWGSEFSVSNVPYRGTDRLFHNGRVLVMKRLTPPRRFRGFIWAPKGSEIRYCFQMARYKGDGFEIVWDNNFGRDYSLNI